MSEPSIEDGENHSDNDENMRETGSSLLNPVTTVGLYNPGFNMDEDGELNDSDTAQQSGHGSHEVKFGEENFGSSYSPPPCQVMRAQRVMKKSEQQTVLC